MEGLQGDDGLKLAENMIDSMSSLQTKEDVQMSKKEKNKAKSRKHRRHRKKKGHYHYSPRF